MSDLKVKPCLLTENDGEYVVILPGSKIEVCYQVGQYVGFYTGVFCEIKGDCIVLHSSDEIEDIFLSLNEVVGIEFIN